MKNLKEPLLYDGGYDERDDCKTRVKKTLSLLPIFCWAVLFLAFCIFYIVSSDSGLDRVHCYASITSDTPYAYTPIDLT